jgi:hypothetical protein
MNSFNLKKVQHQKQMMMMMKMRKIRIVSKREERKKTLYTQNIPLNLVFF